MYPAAAPESHLTSSRFDSSVGRGDFDVPIGTGRVIKGWDEGIVSADGGMSLGEKATLTITRYSIPLVPHIATTNQFTATTVTVLAASPVPSPVVPLSSSVSPYQLLAPQKNQGCLLGEPHQLTPEQMSSSRPSTATELKRLVLR